MRKIVISPKEWISPTKSGVYRIIAFCLLTILLSRGQAELSKPSPPDLRDCNRIEIQYLPSTLDYFFGSAEDLSLLSPEEIEYLQSLETIVVDDEEYIGLLAFCVYNYSYYRDLDPNGTSRIIDSVHIACYNNDQHLTSLTIRSLPYFTVDEKYLFECEGNLRLILRLFTPQIRPYEMRLVCANRLRYLRTWLLYLRTDYLSEITYPSPSEWCDMYVQDFPSHDYLDYTTGGSSPLKCPSASSRRSDYAMNPDCEPNSPPDTVLFFETKVGWNQHGGPKLFTFNNHDPKGGCVLLNDGTVKFIRTGEGLSQLRWK
jgi:hypothetical protein